MQPLSIMPAAALMCEIVIPCYRESARLPMFLESLAAEIMRRGLRARITVVDDGSGEKEVRKTLAAIASIREAYEEIIHEPLLMPENLGKGAAIYQGWRHVATDGVDFLCFADADGSTDAHEICNLITHAMVRADTVDAVFGSRVKMLGKHVERSLIRHLLGRCFATLGSVITGVDIYDSQCGAKVIKRKAFLPIADSLGETGFAFDVELTLALLQNGYRVVEMPVSWRDVAGSKVQMSRDIWKMSLSLLRIRRRHGYYRAMADVGR